MPNIVTFLTYKDRAEEAAKLYTSIFKDARILSTLRYPDVSVSPSPGAVMVVEIELLGQRYVLLNGGDHFKFTDAISLSVECDSQEEIDRYWEALVAGGGEHGPCGWLKDRFGVSWQVSPRDIAKYWGPSVPPDKAKRAMEAMMKMSKLDIAALDRAVA